MTVDAPASELPSSKKPGRLRQLGLAAFAAASLVIGFLVGEAALIAPVIFFDGLLGFVPGLIVFTSSCVALGLGVLGVVDHFWPDRVAQANPPALEKGRVRRMADRAGRMSRTAGAIVVAWYCGPFASPPILRAIGYHGRSLMIWVIVSGLLFGSFWFSFYGGAFNVMKRVVL